MKRLAMMRIVVPKTRPMPAAALVVLWAYLSAGCALPKREGVPMDSVAAVSETVAEPLVNSVVMVAQVPEGRLLIEPKPSDSTTTDGMPRSNIYFEWGGRLTRLMEMVGEAYIIEKDQYSGMDIPENALEACGAWWAGGGTYVYVVPDGQGFRVFSGWLDEEQETSGLHWEQVLEIR